jgi:hypothetical protein
VISTEELQSAQLGMGQLCSFGLTFGMITFLKTNSQGFSFAKNKLISVAKFLATEQLGDLFHLPLSNEAWQEYQALQTIIQGIQVTEGGKDYWKYIWREI